MQQRKSRRLVARAVKEADAQRPDDDHALSGVDGMGASFLLQRCSEIELALLTSQACTFYSHLKTSFRSCTDGDDSKLPACLVLRTWGFRGFAHNYQVGHLQPQVVALQSLPEAALAEECGWQEVKWRDWLVNGGSDRNGDEDADAWTLPEDARSKLSSWLARQALSMLQQPIGCANGLHSPAVANVYGDAPPQGLLTSKGVPLPDQDEPMTAATEEPSTEDGAAAEAVPAVATEGQAGVSTDTAGDVKEEAASGLTGISADQAATFTSWGEWQAALLKQQPPLPLNAAEDEYLHPYTELLLEQGPTQYILRPEPDTRHVASMSGIATPSAVTPSASAEDGSAFTAHPGTAADAGADSASTPRLAAGFHPMPSALAAVSTADHSPETPALQPMLVKAESSAGLQGLVGPEENAERVASGSFAGPSTPVGEWGPPGSRGPLARQRSQVNYSVMAGNKGGKAEQSKPTMRKAKGLDRHEPRHKGQTAIAVQSAVASGEPAAFLKILHCLHSLESHTSILH